jgi:hypothetical protein
MKLPTEKNKKEIPTKGIKAINKAINKAEV